MKGWQVVVLVLLVVVGIGVVVFFATRRSSDTSAADETDGTMGNSTADTVEGVGNLATGVAAGIARLAT